ncbi:MAG: hypothetical protein K0U47_00280 [Epsilonproteobacteria bacterium]|nr:hypothetical protein [Campylobacterota bacterium]
MKKILSFLLVSGLLLTGCGGGSSSTQTTNQPDTETKSTGYQADENGKVLTIELAGTAESVAVSDEALFVAEGEDGIEVLKIGYNDKLSSELITKIDGINAKSVSLSEDGKRLHVVNNEGFVNIINITNISNPVVERTTTQQEISKAVTSKDGNYEYLPKDSKGLEIYDVSNPSSKLLVSTFNKSSAYGLVLVNQDTKALVAAGSTGINVLDIVEPTTPNSIANLTLDGNIKGISLNEKEGLLFVANGDNGVLVYYLNLVLDKLITTK